jgi:hypothetical protein
LQAPEPPHCSNAQEKGIDQFEALREVQQRTLEQAPEHGFLAGGDVRIGEFILLVDSDTRVPRDCILPVVTELLLSPKVAFTQHFTTPMQVTTSWAVCAIKDLSIP